MTDIGPLTTFNSSPQFDINRMKRYDNPEDVDYNEMVIGEVFLLQGKVMCNDGSRH